MEDKEQIYTQKEKSIIGRAVIGGLIAGPAGAIVGGMTGAGTKTVKEKMPDLFITIDYTSDSGQDSVILLSCKYKDKAEVSRFLEKAYPSKFNINKEVSLNNG